MDKCDTPVLFLIFNRLATSQRVLAAIRQARPPRLYVAADGPRTLCLGEAEQVRLVREAVLGQVDWDCEVKTLFRTENLGCRRAVSSAIDWFFAQESEGIILEDDCLPDGSFFPYAQALLTHYRDDQRVMAIGGTHSQGTAYQPPYSYGFSRNIEVWGWASWRRAWQHYDRDLSQWPNLRDTDWLLTIGAGDRNFQGHWQRIFDQAFAGALNTWDYQWVFSCWAQHGLTILPAKNLIRNIGFGAAATHTTEQQDGLSDWLSNLPLEALHFPLSHPPTVTQDYAADRWLDRHIDGITYRNEIRAKLLQIRMIKWLWRLIRQSIPKIGRTS
jgi:hypothetical protein